MHLCEDTLIAATFDIADVFSKAGILTGYWGIGEEFRNMIDEEYIRRYKGTEYYEFAKEMSRAILQLAQASTTMQFLGGHRGDFLRFRRFVEKLSDLSKGELKEAAYASLDFVTNIILEWQEEGLL